MSDKLRQSLIGLIWPGPIAGPLPVNTFRILAPILVLYLGAVPAALVMSVLSAGLALFYFSLLDLAGGKEYVEGLLRKLPGRTHEHIESRGPIVLFATSILVGVFPYAIFLKLLKYPSPTAAVLLILAAVAGSFLWTGIFWGTVVGLLKSAVGFAF